MVGDRLFPTEAKYIADNYDLIAFQSGGSGKRLNRLERDGR